MSLATEVRTPHSGQKRPPSGRRAPQLAQLAGGTDPLLGFRLARARLQCPEHLGRPPAKRADERPVVLVGNLPRPMVELELLQGGQDAALLLGKLEPATFELVGLTEAVLRRREPWSSQERQRDDQDSNDRKENPQREPDAHTRNASSSRASGFGRSRRPPGGHPIAVLLAQASGRVLGERVAVALPVGGAHEGRNDLEVPLVDLGGFTPEIGDPEVDVELEQVDAGWALRHGKKRRQAIGRRSAERYSPAGDTLASHGRAPLRPGARALTGKPRHGDRTAPGAWLHSLRDRLRREVLDGLPLG